MIRLSSRLFSVVTASALLLAPLAKAQQETCQTEQEMDPAARSAIERTVQQFYSYASAGDSESVRRNTIPGLANSFQGIAAAINDNKDKIAGGQATLRSVFFLNAPGNAVYDRAEFFCGLFNSPQRTSFAIPGLPPGTYALAIQDVRGSKVPYTITYVLQQNGGQWQLAGYYARLHQIGPHDGLWYWVQARDMKKQNQLHNAFFYYQEAVDLIAPVPFMSNTQLDKLYEEAQDSTPKDIPTNPQQPLPVNLNGRTYQVQQMFAVPDPNNPGLDLIVKYTAISDISNTGQAFQDNMTFLKSFAAQYPEYKNAFTALVGRAVAPSGQDYGSVLPTKDIR